MFLFPPFFFNCNNIIALAQLEIGWKNILFGGRILNLRTGNLEDSILVNYLIFNYIFVFDLVTLLNLPKIGFFGYWVLKRFCFVHFNFSEIRRIKFRCRINSFLLFALERKFLISPRSTNFLECNCWKKNCFL